MTAKDRCPAPGSCVRAFYSEPTKSSAFRVCWFELSKSKLEFHANWRTRHYQELFPAIVIAAIDHRVQGFLKLGGKMRWLYLLTSRAETVWIIDEYVASLTE